MRKYRAFVKAYLAKRLLATRKELKLTQEKMSESLRMSVRSYTEIERGRSGFSATTLLFFLSGLPEEQALDVIRGFREGVEAEESREDPESA